MKVLPFNRAHLANFEPLIDGLFDVGEEHIASLESAYSFSVFHDDGRVLAVGGLAPNWAGRWTAWCGMSKHAGPYMTAITRIAKEGIERAPVGDRVEASTVCGFKAGYKWLRMLGFQMEAPCMRSYLPGQDHALFARVIT